MAPMCVYLSEIGTMSVMFKPLLKRGESLIYEIKKYEKAAHAIKHAGCRIVCCGIRIFQGILGLGFSFTGFLSTYLYSAQTFYLKLNCRR